MITGHVKSLPILILTACLLPTQVSATALFEAISDVSLTVTGFSGSNGQPLTNQPGDIIVSGDALVILNDTAETEDAIAISNPLAQVIGNELDLGIDDGTLLEIDSFGDALAPPDASALVDVQTEGNIFIDNLSNSTGYFVNFLLDFFYDVELAVDNLVTENATLELLVNVFDQDDNSFFAFDRFFDTDLGDQGIFTDTTFIDFSVFVAPNSSLTIIAENDALGTADSFAVAQVSAPTTLSLLILGLLGVIRARTTAET